MWLGTAKRSRYNKEPFCTAGEKRFRPTQNVNRVQFALGRFLICLFCVCRSWKRSRRSWRTRPGCSVACLEKNPTANRSQHSRPTRLLCSGSSQLWANPASSRLWFNPYKVSHNQEHACIIATFYNNILHCAKLHGDCSLIKKIILQPCCCVFHIVTLPSEILHQ